ncbi:hypothetical protein Tco_0741039, partial [Tanacetum coccineum]
MPKATTTDVSLTKSYIPKVSKIPGISPTIAQFYKPIENRNIHEGRVVDQAYYKSNNIERLFTNIRFNCLFQINEPIVPRFILDFYSQVTVQTDDYGYLVISFMIQHEFITLTLAQFGQILKIPYNGQAVFTNEWDLASLEYSQETEGPYCTDLPTPDDIRRLLELERVVVDRTIKSQTVSLNPNQILTKELSPDMKQWEELIQENVLDYGGHRVSSPCLKRKFPIIPPKQLFIDLTKEDTTTPSPKFQVSSPSAPNASSKTPSTKDTSSSSIDYTPKSPTLLSSPSTNGYLNSPLPHPPRVPPPSPTQAPNSMEITISLSPITPLDVHHNSPSLSQPIIGHPISWNLLKVHGSCSSDPFGNDREQEESGHFLWEDVETGDVRFNNLSPEEILGSEVSFLQLNHCLFGWWKKKAFREYVPASKKEAFWTVFLLRECRLKIHDLSTQELKGYSVYKDPSSKGIWVCVDLLTGKPKRPVPKGNGYGKCKHKIASCIGKTKDNTPSVAFGKAKDTVYKYEERAKDVAGLDYAKGKASEKVIGYHPITVGKSLGKTKDTLAHGI